MKKAQLYKLYEGYLQKNPQKEYVRNLNFDERGREESSYECIDSAHIQDNQILRDENLPEYLTTEQLYKLDEKYNHELKWKILESDVTEEQIAIFEQENDITLPKQFREFIQGYSLLQWRFSPKCVASEDYLRISYVEEKDDYRPLTNKELEQGSTANVLVDFYGICNPNGLQHYTDEEWESADLVESIGLIHLGVINREEWLFLDCETGEVQSWQHDEIALEAETKEEFEEESEMGDFWFKDFDAFLEWLFGKTVYIFEDDEDDDF
ncbi:MAG: hypothetical protein K2H91_14785 [Lachnospiraceae bacterium]|nr:hypothetical protein [Lachnospiraceae bacterium]